MEVGKDCGTSVLLGRDGVVRAAKVQVLNTDRRLIMLCRPIQYLYHWR